LAGAEPVKDGPTRLALDPLDPALGGNVIGGDRRTYHPALWSFLISRFAVTSMLDVGCAEGHCVKYFADQGIHAVGFDGMRQNVERAITPIVLHDLRDAPYLMPVDLLHCCEVVEHVAERYLPNLLATLANGRVIAMTHAVPGQGGHHHVNEQPAEYWIERVEALGYTYLPEETAHGKELIENTGQWTYFVGTGLIFERDRAFRDPTRGGAAGREGGTAVRSAQLS
jgi:SAM-dependent methyltransferase